MHFSFLIARVTSTFPKTLECLNFYRDLYEHVYLHPVKFLSCLKVKMKNKTRYVVPFMNYVNMWITRVKKQY